jgi:hypothetical protein
LGSNNSKGSFWTSLPGILLGVAALITAVVGAVALFLNNDGSAETTVPIAIDTTTTTAKATMTTANQPQPPVIRFEAEVIVPLGCSMNLEDGSLPPSGCSFASEVPPFDVLNLASQPRILRSVGEATLALMGNQPVGFEGCRDAPPDEFAISLTGLPVGSHICARTNEGRVSELIYQGDAPFDQVIRTIFHVTTWEEVVS